MRSLQLLFAIFTIVLLVGCSQTENAEEGTEAGSSLSNSEQQSANQEGTDKPDETEDNVEENTSDSESKNTSEDSASEATEENPVEVKNPEDIQVLVNKSHLLPEGYEPPDLVNPDVPFYFEEDLPKRYMREEAAAALEEMFKETQSEGLDLVAASAYRSYERQKRIYEANVESKGQEEADKVSAFPGASEHQTGLAIDVTSPEMGYGLSEAFGETDEGKWLAENAHNYGFIIRYPEGRTEDTGYNYEPWHLRYVGEEPAQEVYEKDLIWEEYHKN